MIERPARRPLHRRRAAASRRSAALATLVVLAALASVAVTAMAGLVAAQPDDAALAEEGEAHEGYELALEGAPAVVLGERYRASGVAYAVRGLADLAPLPRASVRAALRRFDRERDRHETVVEETVAADAQGRFAIDLAVPAEGAAPLELVVTVGRPGRPGRAFAIPLASRSPLALEVLLDRRRYEAGETVHVFARLARDASGRPERDAPLRIAVSDPSGRVLADEARRTSRAGVVTLALPLAGSAVDGSYAVTVRTDGTPLAAHASRAFEVGRRTVERLLVTVELVREVVAPSGHLEGRVVVRTPSGAPVRDAEVALKTDAREEVAVVRTDAAGVAAFRLRAPAFLSGDVARATLEARASHPGHGAATASAGYVLARVAHRVEAIAAHGALLPELDGLAYVSVTDPLGRPSAAGATFEAIGAAVQGGRARGTLDANGLAEVPMRVGRGMAATIRTPGSLCEGRVGVEVLVRLELPRPEEARVCVAVARDARVQPTAERSRVAPGERVEIRVARAPSVTSFPVLVELLRGDAVLAAAVAEPRASSVRIVIPGDVTGLVRVRARAMAPASVVPPHAEPGATLLGAGAEDALLVRPRSAFALSVTSDRREYAVREAATLRIVAAPPPDGAHAAVVVRDLAAHGGEPDFRIPYLDERLREAMLAEDTPAARRLLASALAGFAAPDDAPTRPAPLVIPPHRDDLGAGYDPDEARADGVLRDPLALRDELLRRGVGAAMVALESRVRDVVGDRELSEGLLVRTGGRIGFHPRALEAVVRAGRLERAQAETAGGEGLEVAMLTAADPSFRFETVAARITRERLVALMVAVAGLGDPDDPRAERLAAHLPPERWLARLVQLGVIAPEALLDGFGRPMAFRPAPAGRAPLLLSDRAPGYEIASAGADGRLGTADDLRDPFARVVPAGTPYAVASGEDDLLTTLSMVAPGEAALAAMAEAYRALGLAAQDEQRPRAVTAAASEAAEVDAPLDAYGYGAGGFGTIGRGGGRGMGSGYGAGAGSLRGRAASAPPVRAGAPAPGRFAVLGEVLRERFPATLFFRGEVPLVGGSTELSFPLADALTSYRVEVAAFTADGYSAHAAVELAVDQDATVDAPIPAYAAEGDRLRLPVRIRNRTEAPLEARLALEAVGLEADVRAPELVRLGPGEARTVFADVSLRAPGDGALVVRVYRPDGRSLDAVRRPLAVHADARRVREERELLLRDGATIEVDVPAGATALGAGELRVLAGPLVLGEAEAAIGTAERAQRAWMLALAGLPAEAEARRAVHVALGEDLDPWTTAAAVGAGYRDPEVRDEPLAAALARLSRLLPPDGGLPEGRGEDVARALHGWSRALLGLAPAGDAPSRAAVDPALAEVRASLVRAIASAAAGLADAPAPVAEAAAALALGGGERARPRATELVRRVARDVVRVGDEAFLEPAESYGVPGARVVPTAMLALAAVGLGRPEDALPFARSLAAAGAAGSRLGAEARLFAAAALARLAPGQAPGDVRVTVDGAEVAFAPTGPARVATIDALAAPGRHVVRVAMPRGSIARGALLVRYGLPWSAAPRRDARVAIAIDGPPVALDGRAAWVVELRNRGPRLIHAPELVLELPAGAELDEDARAALASRAAAPPTIEGRTLRLPLRPLAPASVLRLPLRARLAVAGRLRGLGAVLTARDGAGSEVAPASVIPPRVLEVAEAGAEPEAPARDREPPPARPSPAPIPRSRPIAALDAARRSR